VVDVERQIVAERAFLKLIEQGNFFSFLSQIIFVLVEE